MMWYLSKPKPQYISWLLKDGHKMFVAMASDIGAYGINMDNKKIERSYLDYLYLTDKISRHYQEIPVLLYYDGDKFRTYHTNEVVYLTGYWPNALYEELKSSGIDLGCYWRDKKIEDLTEEEIKNIEAIPFSVMSHNLIPVSALDEYFSVYHNYDYDCNDKRLKLKMKIYKYLNEDNKEAKEIIEKLKIYANEAQNNSFSQFYEYQECEKNFDSLVSKITKELIKKK